MKHVDNSMQNGLSSCPSTKVHQFFSLIAFLFFVHTYFLPSFYLLLPPFGLNSSRVNNSKTLYLLCIVSSAHTVRGEWLPQEYPGLLHFLLCNLYLLEFGQNQLPSFLSVDSEQKGGQ